MENATKAVFAIQSKFEKWMSQRSALDERAWKLQGNELLLELDGLSGFKIKQMANLGKKKKEMIYFIQLHAPVANAEDVGEIERPRLVGEGAY
jgi:hypothetical protein